MGNAKKDKRKRKWPWIVGGLILLVLGAALLVTALLFGGEREFPVDPLQPEDYTLVGKLTSRLLNEIRSGRPKESELVLSPKEVASLLRIADNGVTLGAMPGNGSSGKTKPHNVRFENGRFEIVAPIQTGAGWLWGGVIMLDTSVRPEKQDETFTIDISRVKAGSFTLPDSIVERMRKQSLEELRSKKEYQQFDRCIKSIQIDDENNLHVVYRPVELLKLMPEESRRIFLPGSGKK